MKGIKPNSDFGPIATHQGWFSQKALSTFLANLFETISQTLRGEPPPIKGYRSVKILPSYPVVPHAKPDGRVLPSLGLKNPGTNCFVNSILQIVFAHPILVDSIVFGKGQHQLVRELYQTYKRAQEQGNFTTYLDLSSPLRELCPEFNDRRQHDAFDFWLRVLIEPLEETKSIPFFFPVEERSYYRDYETHQQSITDFFEKDGARIKDDQTSSLQLTFPKNTLLPTMEDLIRSTMNENVPDTEDAPSVEFRKIDQGKVRLKLEKRQKKMRPPPFLFVDLKRHAVQSEESQSTETFVGAKKNIPITFEKTFFIPPEHDIAGKGAKYEWVALINHEGGFSGGHYGADVRTSDGKYYEYSDTSKRELSNQAFIDAGKECYGGFAVRIDCEDVATEMKEQRQKTAVDQEIERTGYGKYGSKKELELVALFNKYLNEEKPSLVNLQKVYDQLSSTFHAFVQQFFPEDPRNHLTELKMITKPLLCILEQAEEGELATHIVAQYEHIRSQNLELAQDHRTQIEKDFARLKKQKAYLEHLATLNESPKYQAIAAAILDSGLEKLIKLKGIEQLLAENAKEEEVLKLKQVNADIHTGNDQ